MPPRRTKKITKVPRTRLIETSQRIAVSAAAPSGHFAAVTAALSFSYGFLESAGFPKLSMFWVWSVMGVVWALHTWLRCMLSR